MSMDFSVREHVPGKRLVLDETRMPRNPNLGLLCVALFSLPGATAIAISGAGLLRWTPTFSAVHMALASFGILCGMLFHGASGLEVGRTQVRLLVRSDFLPFVRWTREAGPVLFLRAKRDAWKWSASTPESVELSFHGSWLGEPLKLGGIVRTVGTRGELLSFLADLADILDLRAWRECADGTIEFGSGLEGGRPVEDARRPAYRAIDASREESDPDDRLAAFDRTARVVERTPDRLKIRSYHHGFWGVALAFALSGLVVTSVAIQARDLGWVAALFAIAGPAYLALWLGCLSWSARPKITILVDSRGREAWQIGLEPTHPLEFDAILSVVVRVLPVLGPGHRAGVWLRTKERAWHVATHDRGGTPEETRAAVLPLALEIARRIGCGVQVYEAPVTCSL